jgi:hypothetical protein
LKDQLMKKISSLLALAGLFVSAHVHAISLDDIQLWAGSGTNRAALVVEWNSPEVFNNTTVPAPVANKTLVWGYRFNGTNATGTEMLKAVLAADPKLYVVADDYFGSTFVDGIGYNLNGNGVIGVADSSSTNFLTNGFLLGSSVDLDSAHALNSGDLYWSGSGGPYWQLWNELGDEGGFMDSPNRGTNAFWDAGSYTHGEWASAYYGLDDLQLTNGSWIGFSISAAGYDSNTNDAAYYAFNNDEQAPPSPDGTYTAYVCNTNDFAVQIVSTNKILSSSLYGDPTAVLNRPTLKFLDIDDFDEDVTDRVKIIEPPYNATPDGNNVITEISNGGQITVKLGRKIYDDPNNPYGVDLIIYGNSFFTGISGGSGLVSDDADLSVEQLTSSAIYGHTNIVSVSQDGTNWFSYPVSSAFFPDEAYRWDDTNSSWTDEEMNPTKPSNPFIFTNNFAGQTVASGLDQFIGASGGSGYDLKASGLPWIQYVRIQPGVNTYTVVDAIAAVNPISVGDALSISPDNLASGITNLNFENPGDGSENWISISFNSVNEIAKISTVSLNDFSPFAPVIGNVSAAYQIQTRPISGMNAVNFSASVSLRAGENYSGSGNDLRVYQWNCTNWISQPFSFNATNNEISVAGVTNFSAFVISQIIPPNVSIQSITNGFAFQFTPVPNCPETLERSTDLVTWTPVSTFTATNAQPIALQDSNAPTGKAFYRVKLNP